MTRAPSGLELVLAFFLCTLPLILVVLASLVTAWCMRGVWRLVILAPAAYGVCITVICMIQPPDSNIWPIGLMLMGIFLIAVQIVLTITLIVLGKADAPWYELPRRRTARREIQIRGARARRANPRATAGALKSE